MERCLYLGDNRILVRTNWGAHVVVPAFNVDVAIGVVRDGVIEPWTTRLVQELLRPGQIVINGGANFGYYSVLAAHVIGAEGLVLAVEANRRMIPYLLLSRHWSGYTDRIQVICRALWSEPNQSKELLFDPQFIGGGSLEELPSDLDVANRVGDLDSAIWSEHNINRLIDDDGFISPDRGLVVSAPTETTTIDTIAPRDRSVDLILLDIEGAEPFALLGARETIRRSSNLRLITEWSKSRALTEAGRAAAEAVFAFLSEEGFRPRRLIPKLAEDGAIFLSPPLSRDDMLELAERGDYVWCREGQDPWEEPPTPQSEPPL